MKKIIIALALLATGASSQAQEGAITLSFVWGIISRGGFMLGYNVTDDVGIEAHLGGVPHVLTYGLTAKLRFEDGDDDQFALLGITRVGGTHPARNTSWATGINLGYRYEFNADGCQTTYPFELGICPLVWRPNDNTNETSTSSWPPVTAFFGGGVQWASKESKKEE